MTVYHASTEIIENPDVLHSRDYLDFGKGFYLTTIREQAEKYALRFIRRGKRAFLNEYELKDDLSNFSQKIFARYDDEWLEYVGACRYGKECEHYDMVSGGIADDKVFNTVDLYFSGEMNKQDALKRLIYEKPNNQICIISQELINNHLIFIRATEIK